jgi:hypothetical protein
MASWIIDEFSVKPSGFLASWRYARVLTDENGNVSVQSVPGKPFANDCVSSYNKRNRRYANGQLITEYCNLDTFTNYRIYAQDCPPFAYAQTDLNAPQCGYSPTPIFDPLPTPADPPNPFGTLHYTPYKYTEFCNNQGQTVRLDILKKFQFTQPQTNILVDSWLKSGTLFVPPKLIEIYVNRLTHTVYFTGQAQNDLNSNRSYEPNDLITEICDFETGFNLKVYAQQDAPFCYIVEEAAASQCQLPVPEEPEYVENWGEDPIILSYKGNDDKVATTAPCECIINLLCTENFSLEEFYTNDEREFQVQVTVEDQVVFKGYIIPDSCQEPFMPTPYEVTIRSTDGLGALKGITYTLPSGSRTDVRQTFLNILAFALAPTNLNLNIRTICNVYETVMQNAADNDPLAQASVNPLRFTGENGNLMSCFEVLESICRLFKARIQQTNGEWVFVRIDELAQDVARTRLYNNKAFFLRAESINPVRLIENMDGDDTIPISMDQHTLIGNAYKRVSVLSEVGKTPSIIFNGDFEQWDGQNFLFWTKYGSMAVDRRLKTITGVGGAQIPLEDYVCLFQERAQADRWLQSNDIFVQEGDSVRLTFNHSYLYAFASFKLRVKVGTHYLTNSVNGTDFSWVTTLATCTITLPTPSVFNSPTRNNINFTMPDAPESGVMVLQFFGPQQYTVGFAANGNAFYTENTDYTPFDIDNVVIAKQSKVDDKLADGTLHVASQLGFYTQKPETYKVLFGDYTNQNTTFLGVDFQINFGSNMSFGDPIQIPSGGNNQSPSSAITLDNLWAIYTADGSYSSAWYEYSSNSGRVPIGLLLAKSILKSYQKPFRYLSGTFLSNNANFLNTFHTDLACIPGFNTKLFALLSCDFGLKSNQLKSVNMTEIFDRYVKSTDASIPHYPGDIEPPIVNNPNTSPTVPTNGIFTDEFTEQFQ